MARRQRRIVVSEGCHTLIHVAAKRLATKHWRLLGVRLQGEVHGFYVELRRRMGVRQCASSRATASAAPRTSACRGRSSSR